MLQEEVKRTGADRIKAATTDLHCAAEAVMMPLLEQCTTNAAYGNLLQRQYGFYRPMEDRLRRFGSLLQVADDSFQRSRLLERDLLELKMPLPESLCTKLPPLETPLQALGALYVLEGAALGGRVILRMLQATGNLQQGAFHFFNGRGSETGVHWKQFLYLLNSRTQSNESIAQVSDAACATFIAHTRWMQTS